MPAAIRIYGSKDVDARIVVQPRINRQTVLYAETGRGAPIRVREVQAGSLKSTFLVSCAESFPAAILLDRLRQLGFRMPWG